MRAHLASRQKPRIPRLGFQNIRNFPIGSIFVTSGKDM